MKFQDEYEKIALEFANQVLESHGAKIDTIILFGSTARGEANEESDIDILVVGDVSLDELLDVSIPLLLQYGKFIAAQDMPKSRFKRLVEQGYSFINNVLNDGVVLFERTGKTSP
ncbi:nucleotidyltransferase domain-containing protein [uncultured Methanobacterium sp.]|uniref:nucleotidyltransferase domain-containing protein n=1 Tax=uncultured Methanobacterium sp. TaxID=176306 RepID=UPI002AA78729|nr:nucleotidyltransferase domain-containing protein [uncultured Methanobacterium sp.]